MYSGQIEGIGPRYCPSIEDKVVRFAEKASHQIFVEPEGLDVAEIYPNGISTSLPFDVQLALVRSIRGMENAHITRPGYAIEYDFFDPRGLRRRWKPRPSPACSSRARSTAPPGTRKLPRRACSPGSQPARFVQQKEAWSPRRDEAYLGVLVDDLITHGTKEPYRMFTSRAEYRLQLREDNADLRLTETGRMLGLVDDARWQRFEAKREAIARETGRLHALWATPANALGREVADTLGVQVSRETNVLDLIKRPELDYAKLMSVPSIGPPWTMRRWRSR